MDMAPQYFNGKPQNIGLRLGDKYGSADVDCDCAEAITAARDLLPETGMIFGGTLNPSPTSSTAPIRQHTQSSFMIRWTIRL